MKKTLIAAAVMAASGVAFAASNVTLYGVVDTSAVFTHDGGATDSKNVIDMQSGFRNGSRWGIKGVEELGNGYAVGFILENGFNSDDGTNGQKYSGGFSRESKLYISGEFGQIGFGRLGSLANGAQSNSILSGWALGTSYQTQGTLTSFMTVVLTMQLPTFLRPLPASRFTLCTPTVQIRTLQNGHRTITIMA